MQLACGNTKGLGKRKQTRRGIFLSQTGQGVPWQQRLGLIEPRHMVSGWPSQQPYALATMLRIHLFQHWYALSNPEREDAVHELLELALVSSLVL